MHNIVMMYVIGFGVFAGVFLLAILIILWIGIDVRVAVNPDNGFAVVDCFIFKSIFILKIKIIVYNGEFYMRIGNGVFRRMLHYKGDVQEGGTKVKQFPKLTVHDLRTRVCVGSDDPLLATALIAVFGFVTNNLRQLTHNRLKIKGYNELLKPDYINDSLKISVDANIKFSFIRVLLYVFSGKKLEGDKIDEH